MATQYQSAEFYSDDWPLQSPYVEQSGGNGTKNTEAQEDFKLERLHYKDAPAIPFHAFTSQRPTRSFEKESFDPETFPWIPNSPKAEYQVPPSREVKENVNSQCEILLPPLSPVAQKLHPEPVVQGSEPRGARPTSPHKVNTPIPGQPIQASNTRPCSHSMVVAPTNNPAPVDSRHTVHFARSPLPWRTTHAINRSDSSSPGSFVNCPSSSLSNQGQSDSQPGQGRPVSQFVAEIRQRPDIAGRRINPKLARMRGANYDTRFAGARDFGDKAVARYFPELEMAQTASGEGVDGG